MADETPMSPISAAEPPKADPLKPVTPGTVKLSPVIRKPEVGATQTALKPGLKLPPKPGATVSALRPGLKLPPKPGATVSALRPGLKLPTKPVIHKPGEAAAAPAPLPKPIAGVPAPAAAPAPAAPQAAKPAEPQAAQASAPVQPASAPSPMAALKTVTQKLKGITQQIPAQAILKKTGIIDDGAMSASQKEAAKHKTARISLSDAMGVAPVKNENAPMKTIHIKRPADIGGATKPLAPQPKADGEAVPESAGAAPDSQASSSVTQRKTLKISRPTGGVRPGGKFGIKRPAPAGGAPAEASAATPVGEASAAGEVPGDIPDLANIPDMSTVVTPAAADEGGPAWLVLLSTVVQLAACVAVGALAYMLFENTQVGF